MHRPKRPDELARESAGAPPEPIGTKAAALGTVKYWRDDKGYGAIASEATAPWDIWCHFGQIDAPGFRSLGVGERVALEYIRADQESFRYRATRVRRLDAGPSTDR
jgi:cold shock protein